ncbi:MAG TPA: PIG-L family deacetylase [Verrucomicrobiae bacterium]|nr:PIG-L family deacetylase [Verrucomicrobiae bacterium]
MKFNHPQASVYVPDGKPVLAALKRVTHLGIGAHQDDLEFMALQGIVECRGSRSKWFGGVTCTNGSGSARTGEYKKFTDEQMMAVRRREQDKAAKFGGYAAMIQLDYSSGAVKSSTDASLKDDLKAIFTATQAQVVYTHNLADKHDTHIGVVVAAIQAMRELPKARRPVKVIGCEVWRDLDWLADAKKVVMDVSGHDKLAAKLNGMFDSQISGGKRYDLATLGRRSANATFFNSHSTDAATQVIFGMDLTPLVQNPKLDIAEYALNFIDEFRGDVKSKISQRLGTI